MIIDENKAAIDLWKIIAHHGYAHQKEKAIEEMGELQRALARDLQGIGNRENIAEETADVYIMLAQLQLIYGNSDAVDRKIEEKMKRTLDGIEAERQGKGV